MWRAKSTALPRRTVLHNTGINQEEQNCYYLRRKKKNKKPLRVLAGQPIYLHCSYRHFPKGERKEPQNTYLYRFWVWASLNQVLYLSPPLAIRIGCGLFSPNLGLDYGTDVQAVFELSVPCKTTCSTC